MTMFNHLEAHNSIKLSKLDFEIFICRTLLESDVWISLCGNANSGCGGVNSSYCESELSKHRCSRATATAKLNDSAFPGKMGKDDLAKRHPQQFV